MSQKRSRCQRAAKTAAQKAAQKALQPAPAHKRRWPTTALLIVGLVLTLLLGVWFAARPGFERAAVLAEEQRLLEERIAAMPMPTPKPVELPSPTDVSTPEPNPEPTPTPTPLPYTGKGILFYDRLEMQLPLTEGVSVEQLKTAVGHVPETAPIGGEGNAVVAGHRSYNYGNFFNRLGEAQVGDIIRYEDVSGGVFTYQVYQLLEIEPTDQTAFVQPEGEYLLTLYTCTPIWSATQRLLVRAKLTEN